MKNRFLSKSIRCQILLCFVALGSLKHTRLILSGLGSVFILAALVTSGLLENNLGETFRFPLVHFSLDLASPYSGFTNPPCTRDSYHLILIAFNTHDFILALMPKCIALIKLGSEHSKVSFVLD